MNPLQSCLNFTEILFLIYWINLFYQSNIIYNFSFDLSFSTVALETSFFDWSQAVQ